MAFRRHRPFIRLLGFASVSFFTLASLVFLSDRWVKRSSREFLFDDHDSCPPVTVALVLGCSPEVASGRPNFYFTSRMKAAAGLYHAGKCRYLLVSGDNRDAGYDEPTAMKEALVALGVPEPAIVRDYAGFDTLDSVLRAKEVFEQSRYLVVSQAFHNERAVAIARHHGIEAYGLNAPDFRGRQAIRMVIREKLARVKTLGELKLLGSQPKYLGPIVSIGSGEG